MVLPKIELKLALPLSREVVSNEIQDRAVISKDTIRIIVTEEENIWRQ